jgi:hypothetical protein
MSRVPALQRQKIHVSSKYSVPAPGRSRGLLGPGLRRPDFGAQLIRRSTCKAVSDAGAGVASVWRTGAFNRVSIKLRLQSPDSLVHVSMPQLTVDMNASPLSRHLIPTHPACAIPELRPDSGIFCILYACDSQSESSYGLSHNKVRTRGVCCNPHLMGRLAEWDPDERPQPLHRRPRIWAMNLSG